MDDQAIRRTTTFQMPGELREKVNAFVHKKDFSLSHLVEKELEDFLEKQGGPINKSLVPRTVEDKAYTSIILPIELRDRAKVFAAQSNISFGDLIRYVLGLYITRKATEIEDSGNPTKH